MNHKLFKKKRNLYVHISSKEKAEKATENLSKQGDDSSDNLWIDEYEIIKIIGVKVL
ncbi:MAG: hypothetical protein ACMUJM_25470 [bacterium]